MGGLLDFWATVYRNSRAIGAAVAIWLAVAVMWGMKCQNERDPMLSRGEAAGTVVEVLGRGTDESGAQEDRASEGADFGMRPMVIQLADSTRLEMVVSSPYPSLGDRVPLQVENYESGKMIYYFDVQRWQMSGSGF